MFRWLIIFGLIILTTYLAPLILMKVEQDSLLVWSRYVVLLPGIAIGLLYKLMSELKDLRNLAQDVDSEKVNRSFFWNLNHIIKIGNKKAIVLIGTQVAIALFVLVSSFFEWASEDKVLYSRVLGLVIGLSVASIFIALYNLWESNNFETVLRNKKRTAEQSNHLKEKFNSP